MTEMLSTSAYAALITVAVYAITLHFIGDRAKYLPVGAGIAAIVLAPWWAALFCGLFVHCLAAAVLQYFRHGKADGMLLRGLTASAFAFAASHFVATQLALTDAVKQIAASDKAAWERIAARSEAGAFVVENYRPCITPSRLQGGMMRPFAWGTTTLVSRSETECKAATLTLAARKGDDFSRAVDKVLTDLPQQFELTPDAQAAAARVFDLTQASGS